MSLDERYGRRPAGTRRRRWPFVAAGLFALAAAAWAVWAAVSLSASALTWRDVDVQAGPDAVRVAFEVSLAPGRPAVCAVRAVDGTGAVVGWVDVPVEAPPRADARQSVQRVVTVRTSQPATGGGVGNCAPR